MRSTDFSENLLGSVGQHLKIETLPRIAFQDMRRDLLNAEQKIGAGRIAAGAVVKAAEEANEVESIALTDTDALEIEEFRYNTCTLNKADAERVARIYAVASRYG